MNTRGMKSKMDSVRNILEEIKPEIAGFAETMLGENDQIEIEGYKVIRNDRNNEGGGILFAVKREFDGVTVEVNRENKTEESLWILLGSRDKVRIGLVYAPQESRTQKKQLEAMYGRIKKEVQSESKQGKGHYNGRSKL